jgi:anti-sigma factor RsiW
MNCPEIRPLVPRFFDGELEGRKMRSVALHVTRCSQCEQELRELEQLQELVTGQISELVDEVDMSRIWQSVAQRIENTPRPWSERVRAWWEGLELDFSPAGAWPAMAAVAAIALFTLALWSGGIANDPSSEIAVVPGENDFIARAENAEVADAVLDVLESFEIDNSVEFEFLGGSVDGLMVEPETGMNVILVSE